MKFLRGYTYRNDVPERSGKREIFAHRFANTYHIRFVRYNTHTVHVKLYTLDDVQFNKLIIYGKRIDHSLRLSTYIIVQNRRAVVWIAKYKNHVRIGVQYPNGSESVRTDTRQGAKDLLKLTCSKVATQTVTENNIQWSIQKFEIKGEF